MKTLTDFDIRTASIGEVAEQALRMGLTVRAESVLLKNGVGWRVTAFTSWLYDAHHSASSFCHIADNQFDFEEAFREAVGAALKYTEMRKKSREDIKRSQEDPITNG